MLNNRTILKKYNKNFVDKQKFSLNDYTTHSLYLNRCGNLKLLNQIALSTFRHMKHSTHLTQHTPAHTQNTLQPMHSAGHTAESTAHTPPQSQAHFQVPRSQQALKLSSQHEPLTSYLNSEIETILITT